MGFFAGVLSVIQHYENCLNYSAAKGYMMCFMPLITIEGIILSFQQVEFYYVK